MPRWKALPDELDPQIKEFASQLRRLVDRGGLSVAALADRTGYSKTSWERYLNGRLLAPKGAIVALAEVTGTNPVHLTTMWELAERSWSRSEMRHDMTMEAIRISQARAALGEFGGPPVGGAGTRTARKDGGAAATSGVAGPAGVAPSIPAQPTAPDADARDAAGRGPSASPRPGTGAGPRDGIGRSASAGPREGTGHSAPVGPRDGAGRDAPAGPREHAGPAAEPAVNSWRVAGTRGPDRPQPVPAGPATGPAAGAGGTPPVSGSYGGPGAPGAPAAYGAGAAGPHTRPPQSPPTGSGGPGVGGRGSGRRRSVMFLAGVVGMLVVIGAVYFFTANGDDKKADAAAKSPSPTASKRADLPPGVKCAGADCTGKDAETMGCSGDLVTTAKSATVGATAVEVRYSKTCGTAWARITGAAQGDEVHVSVGGTDRKGGVTETGETIAYTPMVAVKDAGEAKACATLASGLTGCTK